MAWPQRENSVFVCGPWRSPAPENGWPGLSLSSAASASCVSSGNAAYVDSAPYRTRPPVT